MEWLEKGVFFNFIILGEEAKALNTSYIRKTKPDYLLEVKGLNLRIVNDDGTERERFPEPLDCSFLLNFGDLFLCAINSLEVTDNLFDYVEWLFPLCMAKRNECNLEVMKYINQVTGPKNIDDSTLIKLNQEYKSLRSAISFCAYISLVIHENEKNDGLFSAALTDLLSKEFLDYGALNADQLQENLMIKNLFSEVSVTIRYRKNGNDEYIFKDLFSLIGFEIRQIIGRKNEIKICANCGRFFIPANRSDEKYCDFLFHNFKTCKQVAFSERLGKDEALKAYRKIYKTQNARKQRNAHRIKIAKYFELWSKYAKVRLRQCQDGKISLEQMINDISGDSWMEGSLNNG